MSNTFPETLPAQSSSPKNAMQWTPTGDGRGVLTIDTQRCRYRYLVCELPAPKNVRCFRLTKLDPGSDAEGDTYYAGVGPGRRTCSVSAAGSCTVPAAASSASTF